MPLFVERIVLELITIVLLDDRLFLPTVVHLLPPLVTAIPAPPVIHVFFSIALVPLTAHIKHPLPLSRTVATGSAIEHLLEAPYSLTSVPVFRETAPPGIHITIPMARLLLALAERIATLLYA